MVIGKRNGEETGGKERDSRRGRGRAGGRVRGLAPAFEMLVAPQVLFV